MRRRRALLPLLVLVALALCGREAWAAPLEERALTHAGRQRSYLVYVPPGHDRERPTPLVLALHGGGGTARQVDAATNGAITREAEARGWLVVFPQGVDKGWNDGRTIRTRRDAGRRNVDDVGFLSTVIDRVQEEWGTDPTRVYATGISNGGFMSFRLGVDLADRIAAIAPVTAQMTPQLTARRPSRPVPVLLLNGTADPLVPYLGGQVRVLGRDRGAVHSTDTTIRFWVTHNRCRSPARVEWLPDRTRDGTRVQVTTYTAGGDGDGDGAEVILYKIVGGGHTWPGGRQYLPRLLVGRVCRDVDGTKTIFDFFARHRRRPASTSTETPPNSATDE